MHTRHATEKMSRILAIDTSAHACSVALLTEPGMFSQCKIQPQGQSDLLLPMVQSVLNEAQVRLEDLSLIAFGQGPGSFTGLRIAAGAAQGLALAANLPVMGISSLASIAHGVWCEKGTPRVLVAMDARMKEVYWAGYVFDDTGFCNPVGDEHLSAPEEMFLVSDERWVASGDGWQTYADQIPDAITALTGHHEPTPESIAPSVAQLALNELRGGREGTSPEFAQPSYLRNQVVARTSPT